MQRPLRWILLLLQCCDILSKLEIYYAVGKNLSFYKKEKSSFSLSRMKPFFYCVIIWCTHLFLLFFCVINTLLLLSWVEKNNWTNSAYWFASYCCWSLLTLVRSLKCVQNDARMEEPNKGEMFVNTQNHEPACYI